MKDALGHGSAGKGLTPVQAENAPFKSRFKKGMNHLEPNDPRGAHAQGASATPKLQRRHFEEIAADLKSQRPASYGDNSTKAKSDANGAFTAKVNDMAAKLATTNPGFRKDFFVAAATGGNYRVKGPGANAAAVSRKAKKFTGS